MTKKELKLIICPYCHSKVHLNHIFKEDRQQIEFATVICHCDEFPVLFGILYLHRNKNKNIVNYLKNKQIIKALCFAFEFGKLKSFLFTIFTQLNKYFSISPNNFINSFLIKLLWKMPSSQFKYYFSRHQEKESLLFFLPITFNLPTKNSLWLDVGSGIFNYYPDLYFLYPRLSIISLEYIFQNIYLSRLFYPTKALYICSNFSTGPHFPKNSLDIITFIDSLPFMENQRQSLEIATKSLLAKSGLLCVTSLTEHLYTKDYSHSFPLSSKLIKKFLPSPCQIFDEIKLCQTLDKKNALQKSLLLSTISPQFRYSLLWPQQKLPVKINIPAYLLQKKHTLWKNAKIQWQSKIY